jgi:hypothetical protein
MNFKNFIKKIEEIENHNIDRKFSQDDIKELKFNLDNKINSNICFKNISYNIIIISQKDNIIKFDEDIIKENLKKCDFAFFIFAVFLKNDHHVASLIINNKLKEVILFDILNNNFIKNTSKFFIKKINVNYKFISTKLINKNNYDKLNFCQICVPVSLFFIYAYINFNISLDEFIKFLLKNTLRYKTDLMYKFITFLESN